MSDDLATKSLATPELAPVTLIERRAVYEGWLASGKRIPRPIGNAHNGPCHTRVDDVEPKRSHPKPEVGTIKELPPGAVVRTDEGGDEVPNPSDDIRLGFGRALLKKAEGADPDTAAIIANAAASMLGPIMRTDDDADVKNRVTGQGDPKKGSSPGAATAKKDDDGEQERPRKAPDDDDKGKHDDKDPLKAVMDAIGGIAKRLDALEKRGEDDTEEEDDDKPGEGLPKDLAADSEKEERRRNFKVRMRKDKEGTARFDSMTDHLFFPYQAKADRVYAMLGMAAPRPQHGEKRDDYRRRLLHPLKLHSPEFRHSDLRVVQVDPVAFDHVEKNIYEHAVDACKNPMTVPLGHLREIKETRGGHEYTKFVGRPKSWMVAFMAPSKRIQKIIERSDNSPMGRDLYVSRY